MSATCGLQTTGEWQESALDGPTELFFINVISGTEVHQSPGRVYRGSGSTW